MPPTHTTPPSVLPSHPPTSTLPSNLIPHMRTTTITTPTASPLLLTQGRNKKLKWLKNTKTLPKMFPVGLLLLCVICQLWTYGVINVNMTFFNSSLTSYLTKMLILPHNFFGVTKWSFSGSFRGKWRKLIDMKTSSGHSYSTNTEVIKKTRRKNDN